MKKFYRTKKGFISEIGIREAIDRLIGETKPYETCQLARYRDTATKCANCVLETLIQRLGLKQSQKR